MHLLPHQKIQPLFNKLRDDAPGETHSNHLKIKTLETSNFIFSCVGAAVRVHRTHVHQRQTVASTPLVSFPTANPHQQRRGRLAYKAEQTLQGSAPKHLQSGECASRRGSITPRSSKKIDAYSSCLMQLILATFCNFRFA